MKKLMIAAVAGLALSSVSVQALADGDDFGNFALGVVVGSVLTPQPVYRYYSPPTVTVIPDGYYSYYYRPYVYGYYGYRSYPRWHRHEWREHAWRRHEWREHRRWRRHEWREHHRWGGDDD